MFCAPSRKGFLPMLLTNRNDERIGDFTATLSAGPSGTAVCAQAFIKGDPLYFPL